MLKSHSMLWDGWTKASLTEIHRYKTGKFTLYQQTNQTGVIRKGKDHIEQRMKSIKNVLMLIGSPKMPCR